MIETLEKYGFWYSGSCNCAGPKTLKYKNGDFMVYWNKGREIFRLKRFGKLIVDNKHSSEIENTLKEYFPSQAAISSN